MLRPLFNLPWVNCVIFLPKVSLLVVIRKINISHFFASFNSRCSLSFCWCCYENQKQLKEFASRAQPLVKKHIHTKHLSRTLNKNIFSFKYRLKLWPDNVKVYWFQKRYLKRNLHVERAPGFALTWIWINGHVLGFARQPRNKYINSRYLAEHIKLFVRFTVVRRSGDYWALLSLFKPGLWRRRGTAILGNVWQTQ